jgi:hypothetical protein
MIGDILARGGRSATFPSNSHIEQSKWDAIFGPRPLNISKPEKKFDELKKPSRKSSKQR